MTDIVENQQDNKNVQSARGTKPLVFISHDTKDAELAEAFSKLLSSVSAGVLKSFRSSDKKGNQGIAYGVEWYPEIMKKLCDASDVVALLTHNSVDRPWILYEAGVARGKLNTPLLGIAIGIPLNKANNGPFAQFQNSGDDIDSLTKLVVQLVSGIPNSEPDSAVIKMQVEIFKKQAVIEHKEGDLMEDSSVAKLFEEVKIMFQDLPTRIERNIDPSYKRRKYRFYPKMLGELMFMLKESEDISFVFLVMISMYRDDMPWIYEIGKETYEVLKSNKSITLKEKAFSDFKQLIKISFRHPILMEMGGSKDMMMMDEMMYFMDKIYLKMIHHKE